MKKVLLLLDHAPNYRESFLRELGKFYHLTVIAHPCEKDSLTPPMERIGYSYIELNKTYGNKIRFNFQLGGIIRGLKPDVVCVALNPRYPFRVVTFLTSGFRKKNWIWWGQIFGRTKNGFLDSIRRGVINKSFGALVYSEEIAEKLQNTNVLSFDNSQYSRSDFVKLPNQIGNQINCLFVGRPQERKKLNLLLDIASRYDVLKVRLVGPKMHEYFDGMEIPNNVQLFPSASGLTLREHFEWSNIVVNPGHVGLLVMNAACHNRSIVINSQVAHAPEVILAKEANQFFIDFENQAEVDDLIANITNESSILISKGEELYEKALNKYTVENMAEKHKIFFDKTT